MFIDFPAVDAKMEGLDQVVFPRMVKIRQKYDPYQISDVPGHLKKELEAKVHGKEGLRNKRIAVTAGSRGIPFYQEIMRTLVDTLKAWGADPFIVPAMGSHAGGTVEGQLEMLATFGITEANMGCPILATMEVVEIGTLDDGTPVYCDKYAYASDGIVVVNKIKPHTSFKGPHESGLLKMLCIGLCQCLGAGLRAGRPGRTGPRLYRPAEQQQQPGDGGPAAHRSPQKVPGGWDHLPREPELQGNGLPAV